MSLGAVQMLQKSLEDAQKNLSQTNDAIQRLTGRDLSKPQTPSERRLSGSSRMRGWSEDFPPSKRRAESGRLDSNNTLRQRFAGRIGERGHDRDSISDRDHATDSISNREGRDREGRDRDGRDRDGRDRDGRDREGRDRDGRDREGYFDDMEDGQIKEDSIKERERRVSERERRVSERERRIHEREFFNNNSEDDDPIVDSKPIVQSSVTAAPIPPRPTTDVTETKKSKSRNRRMFGMLMGTLQKFQEDSAKTTAQDKKRAEIEQKIEQAALKEKEEAMKERKGLFLQRKSQRQKVGLLADHVALAELYDEWNSHTKLLLPYIKTKTKPHIYYLPVQHNEATEELLKESQKMLEDKIKERTSEIEQMLTDLTDNTEDPASTDPQDLPTSQPIQIESDITFKRERYETDSEVSDQEE